MYSTDPKFHKDDNIDRIRVVIYRKFITQKMPKLPKIPADAPASSSSGAAAPAAEPAAEAAAEEAAEGEAIELSSSQEQEDAKGLAVGEGSFSGVKDHAWEKRHAAMNKVAAGAAAATAGAGPAAASSSSAAPAGKEPAAPAGKQASKNKKKKHSSPDETDAESDQPDWLRQLYAAKGLPCKRETEN
eukprot:g14022.t1